MARCHQIKANGDQMAFLWRSPSFEVASESFTVNKWLLREEWMRRALIDETAPLYGESIHDKWQKVSNCLLVH